MKPDAPCAPTKSMYSHSTLAVSISRPATSLIALARSISIGLSLSRSRSNVSNKVARKSLSVLLGILHPLANLAIDGAAKLDKAADFLRVAGVVAVPAHQLSPPDQFQRSYGDLRRVCGAP